MIIILRPGEDRSRDGHLLQEAIYGLSSCPSWTFKGCNLICNFGRCMESFISDLKGLKSKPKGSKRQRFAYFEPTTRPSLKHQHRVPSGSPT